MEWRGLFHETQMPTETLIIGKFNGPDNSASRDHWIMMLILPTNQTPFLSDFLTKHKIGIYQWSYVLFLISEKFPYLPTTHASTSIPFRLLPYLR